MATNIRRYSQKDLSPSLQTPIVIDDQEITDAYTSVALTGYGALGYEVSINEAFVWLSENFANTTPPDKAVKGQVWFKTDSELLYVYTGLDDVDGGNSLTFPGDWVVPDPFKLYTILGNTGSINDVVNHINDMTNPHEVTKDQLGLGLLENTHYLKVSRNFEEIANGENGGDVITARDNLDVYDKAYIDNNFMTNTTNLTNITHINDIAVDDFLRRDINNDYNHTFRLGGTDPLLFTNATSTPLSFHNGKTTVTINDNGYEFSLKGNVSSTPSLTLLGQDKYLSTNSGATLIGFNFNGEDGKIDLAAATKGTAGVYVQFDKKLRITPDSLTWDGVEILTESGFTIKGDIIPSPTSTVTSLINNTTNGGRNLGSSTNHFNKTFSREITTSTIIHEDTNAATVVPTNAVFAYKDNTNEIKYTTYDSMVAAFRTDIEKETIIINSGTLWPSSANSTTLLNERIVSKKAHTLGTIPTQIQVSVIITAPVTYAGHTYQINDEIPLHHIDNVVISVTDTDVVFTRAYVENVTTNKVYYDNPHTQSGTGNTTITTTTTTYVYDTDRFTWVDFSDTKLSNKKIKITLIK